MRRFTRDVRGEVSEVDVVFMTVVSAAYLDRSADNLPFHRLEPV